MLALKAYLLNHVAKQQFYLMKWIQVFLDRQHRKWLKNERHSSIHTSHMYSHLPQVASMSDHHLLISKASHDDRTTTQVKELLDDDRINEVARMISGASVTDLTRENAKEMIAQNHRD